MPRLRPRRVALGPWVYEVDADAVRGYPGGIYRVGRVRRVGGDGPRYLEPMERRAVTDQKARVHILAAIVRQDKAREEQARSTEGAGPPPLRELTRERWNVVRKPDKESTEEV